MAVPIVGKYIVLPVLFLLLYVSYGFRIRDVGQAGSVEQYNACVLDESKCLDVDTTINQVSPTFRRNRPDTVGVGIIGRNRFDSGGVRKFGIEVKESNREDVRKLKSFGYGKVRLKIGVNKGHIDDDSDGEDDDDDDDDDDVVIENEEEINEVIDKVDGDTEDQNDDDDVLIEDNDENDDKVESHENLARMEKSSERNPEWSFRSGSKKINKRELDSDEKKENDDGNEINSKGTSIFKRIDVKKILNKDEETDKRTTHDKVLLKKALENSGGENENNESDLGSHDDDDDNDDDVEIEFTKKMETSDDKDDPVVSEKNILPLRKLEKVRLADKDKVKPREIAAIKNVKEQSDKIQEKEIATNVTEELILTNDLQTPLIEVITDKEKKPMLQDTKKKKETKMEKRELNDPIKEPAVGSVKKTAKKKQEIKSVEVKEKKETQSRTKSKNKLNDSHMNKDTVNGKEKTKKPSETSISLSELNNEILRLPNFVPNFTEVNDLVCQQHGKIFLRQLRGYKLWAFQMLDSSAKIPSGLLRGNVNQLGDYDQCLGISARVKVDEKTVKVQGKYCLANVDLYAVLPDMKVPVNLIQSRNFLRGTIHDVGHFVPKFTTINWALCLPAACSATDAQITMSSALSHLNITSGLKFIVDVDTNMCYVRQRTQNYSKETIGVLYFYAMVFCLVFVATLRDYLVVTEGKVNYSERIIMSFSLRRTVKVLMKPGRVDSDDISCIHGIRSLATIALYLGHKMIPIAGSPYSNRIVMTEISNNPMSSLLRVSIVYTDSFLILSGVLSAFNMSKESETRGQIRWFCRYVGRFIRLTPALLVVIFWYAYVMEHIGSGPQWNIMKENANLCKQNSWTNLLYIQNFFPFEEMCATHTHQLALDMQLSLLAPVLVFFLQVKPVVGILLMFFLLQVSATIRYLATTNNYLSVVIFHGMTGKHLYKTANLTYAVSIHRITPYLFGIGLGVLISYTGKNVKIHRIFVIFGWILALFLGTWSIFSPWPMAKRDYVYDPEGSAQYAVLGPVTWALALCWIIFSCFTGHGGIINRLLSNYWLIVFSRISYSVYLTQFAVFFYNLATTRYSSEFQVHRAIDLYEVLTVIIISTILTLFFDIPMQEVKSVLMECTDVSAMGADGNNAKSGDDDKRSKTPINYGNSEDENPGRIDRKKNGDQKILIAPDFYGEKSGVRSLRWMKNERESGDSGRKRSKSAQRSYADTRIHREVTPSRYQEDIQRCRRSLSRPVDDHFKYSNDRNDFREYQRDRSDEMRHERLGKSLRKTPVRLISSGSEDELLQRQGKGSRRPIERPRVSDEEDWEQELRIRRRRFMERMLSEVPDNKSEKEDMQEGVIRRSSAEGKIALLTGTTGCRGMDAWTVSRDPRNSVVGGSSLEPSENEEDSCLTGDYEHSEDERNEDILTTLNRAEETDKYELELESAGKNRTMMMDFSQSSQEENPAKGTGHFTRSDITPVATGKLFKRESIVKSQASEEDPEYLLPERPKLVEQEQEHPFKKAWQMQKSRSEEDGPSAFIIRDVKVQQTESNEIEKKSSPPISRGTPQTFQLVVQDVDLDSRQRQLNENEDDVISNNDEERSAHDSDDSKSTEYSANAAEFSKVDWSNEDEQFDRRENERRQSQGSGWEKDAS